MTANPAAHGSIAYRPDVDGLRAVSVVSVLLFHIGVSFVPGGFVGVDVFFVISGFLITSIIARETDENDFSILRFYERRIRRIYPALLTVLFATAIAAHIIMMPREFREFGRTLVWTPLFASNFLFMGPVGYFEPSSEVKPLLHTWSLGVEEQFYLIFPLLLIAARRFAISRVALVAAIVVASLAASIVSGLYKAPNAYFLLPTRFWELGFGAMLAIRPVAIASPALRQGLGAVGLGAIVFGCLWINESMPFPGWVALIPVGGACLVLMARGSLANRLLETAPFVFIGRISYPMYLWHWPLVVFTQAYMFHPLTPLEGGFVFAATVALSWVTMVVLETPIRARVWLQSRRAVFTAAAIASLPLIVYGIVVYNTKGMPGRLDARELAILKVNGKVPGNDDWCPTTKLLDADITSDCILGDKTKPPSFAILGDNHAWMVSHAVHDLALEKGISGLYYGHIGCPPLRGIDRYNNPCAPMLDNALKRIRELDVANVVLMSRWAIFVDGHDYGRHPWTLNYLLEGERLIPESERFATVRRTLGETIRALEGRRVTIVFSFPEMKFPVPTAVAAASHLGRPVPMGPTVAEYERRQKPVRELMTGLLADHPHLRLLEPAEQLCRSGRCEVAVGDTPLFFDEDHLSREGAKLWAPTLLPILAAPRAAP